MIKSVAKLLVRGHRLPDHVDEDIKRAVEVKSLVDQNVNLDFSDVKASTLILMNKLSEALQDQREKQMKQKQQQSPRSGF